MYALIQNSEVAKYPYGADMLRRDNPNVSFPRNLTEELLSDFGVVVVEPSPVPVHDPLTQSVNESTPIQIEDTWWQDWIIVNLSTEEAADRLQNAKQQLIQRINTKRDELEASGFNYLGKRLDSDERSVLRFNVAVQAAQAAAAAQQSFEIDWTCADNSTLTMGLVEMLGLPVAFAQYGNALHQHARALKGAVEAAQTSAELAAIDIEAGWPS